MSRNGRLVLKPVPWATKLEFETVHAKIFSEDPVDQRWATDRIAAWTARNPVAIPLGVDSTAAFIRAKIQDYTVQNIQNSICLANLGDVSILYCMALIRFVNYVAEECQPYDRSLPLRQIARTHGIPDWIIQLRHQASHSTTPALKTLRLAAETSLKWLDENYWKPEIKNTADYYPKFNDEAEEICQTTLSNYQKLQYQSLFDVEKSTRKGEVKPSIRQVLADISTLAKTNGKNLIETLIKPEFLLSLTVYSKPLIDSSDCFIVEEAVALPESIERFWVPVIAILDQKLLLQDLVLALLKSSKELNDENQRMAIAWAYKILEAHCDSWGESEKKKSCLYHVLKKNTAEFNSLNWFTLLDACLHSLTKYIPAVLPIIVEHVYPPLSQEKKHFVLGLVAIATGALAKLPSDVDKPTKERRLYTIENIKTVLELHEVVEKGGTSLCHTENPWKRATTDNINWADYPLGTVFPFKGYPVSPDAVELKKPSETNAAETVVPDEPAVVAMESDVSKTLDESTEMSVEKENIEEDLEDEEDGGAYITECNADYCAVEDVTLF